MTETTLGDLEQLVLLAVLRLGDGAYAVSVRDELAQHAGRSMTRGTVYVTLDRLERKGCLDSYFADPTPERGGKARRCFRSTEDGLEALKSAQRVLRQMWRGTDLAIDEP
jgi:DNA-binding PadR family transcriptional regulator